MYQMLIRANDPDRYVPGSWNFWPAPGYSVWATALDIAKRENVTVVRIVDEQGRDVPQGGSLE